MEEYLPLSREKYHRHDSVPAELYNERLHGPSSEQTNLYPTLVTKKENQATRFPLFFVYTKALLHRLWQVRLHSEEIQQLKNSLPPIARQQFLNSLISQEIHLTNEIEGVATSQKEISLVVSQEQSAQKLVKAGRLKSTVRMYLSALNGQAPMIQQVSDFRTIYDQLLAGEIRANKQPNGKLFRDELPPNQLLVIGHDDSNFTFVPVQTEAAITDNLAALIPWMNDETIDAICRALVTHFYFENTHPFLDGNGRMGRYLLTSYLAKHLDKYTGVSVATAIHTNLQKYYRLFKETEKADNYSEATFFMQGMLELINQEQVEVLAALRDDKNELESAKKQVGKAIKQQHFTNAAVMGDILYIFAQSKLFSLDQELAIKDRDLIAQLHKQRHYSKTVIRDAIAQLTELGYLRVIKKRPKQHELTLI